MSIEDVVGRFMGRQRAMYMGGEMGPVEEMLTEDIVWHVPGRSPIAGDHRGRAAVLEYFEQRRARAGGTLRITGHEQLVHGDTVIRLADGQAVLGGRRRDWRTVGVYRVVGEQLAEAWLVPLESREFEDAWTSARGAPFIYKQRVRPQDCATSEVMGHPRLLEVFEAAFIEFWREHFGALTESLEGRGLTLAELDVQYRSPVHVDDVVAVEVFLDAAGSTSVAIHCRARVADRPTAATCTSRYVCLGSEGRPTKWPGDIGDSLQSMVRAAARAE